MVTVGSTVTSARVAGALLVERGLVTATQLAEALEHQRAHGGEFEEAIALRAGLRVEDVVAVLQSAGDGEVEVGAILLATGVVDEATLADARERSRRTGQPVGPVLVEMGAISRLDLASALAEQWSDRPALILPPPNARDRHGTPGTGTNGNGSGDVDDLRFAMRALEASVRATRDLDGDPAALESLRRNEELLTARVSALETAMQQPVDAAPELIAEIEGAAARLTTLEQALDGLADATALAEVRDTTERLHAAIEELAARPLPDTGHGERLDELTQRLDALAVLAEASSGADGLAEALAGLEARVEAATTAAADAARVAESLAAVQAAVDDLAARPQGDPELPARIDELAAGVAQVASVESAVGGLAVRIDELAAGLAEASGLGATVGGLVEQVAEAAAATASIDAVSTDLAGLRGAIDELAARPLPDHDLAERLSVLADRVDGLALEALGPAAEAAVGDVTARLDALASAQADAGERVDALHGGLESLRAELASLAARPATDPDLASRLAESAEAIAILDERVGALAPAAGLDELRAAVEELGTTTQAGTASVEERLAGMEARLAEAESKAGGAEAALEAARAHLDQAVAGADERVDAVRERLDRIEQASGAAPSGVAELRDEVTGLAAAVQGMREAAATELELLSTSWAAERRALEERVDALAASTIAGAGDGGAASSSVPATPELTALARQVERLGDRVVEQERSLVEHFARREKAMFERLGAAPDVSQRLTELSRLLEEQRARLDRLSTGTGGAAEGGISSEEAGALKESVFNRLERLASSIDWRFQRLEGGPAAAAGRTDLQTRVEQIARVVEQLAAAGGLEGLDLAAEPSNEVFLALIPSATGHQLIELPGATPTIGDHVQAPFGAGELVVVGVGTSPLPGDDRACVFVEDASAATAAS